MKPAHLTARDLQVLETDYPRPRVLDFGPVRGCRSEEEQYRFIDAGLKLRMPGIPVPSLWSRLRRRASAAYGTLFRRRPRSLRR